MTFTFGSSGSSGGSGASAPAGSNAPATGFNFGAAAPATATAASTGGGGSAPAPASTSSFGGTSTPATAPDPSDGISFGTGSSAAATTTTGAPAAASTTATAPAPSFGGFGASTGTSASTTTGASTTASTAAPTAAPVATALQVPEFDSTFPGPSMWKKVKHLATKSLQASDQGSLAGQELVELLKCGATAAATTTTGQTWGSRLLHPPPIASTPPNMALRQELANKRHVELHGQPAALTPQLLQDVLAIADDLHISEADAFCLYAHVVSSSSPDDVLFEDNERFVDQKNSNRNSVRAREVYLYSRMCYYRTLLLLFQYRLNEDDDNSNRYIVQASDDLLQHGLIDNLIRCIRDLTRRIQKGVHEQQARLDAGAPVPTMTNIDITAAASNNFERIRLDEEMVERQRAAQVLFFIAYHTQWTGPEVANLVDLIRDLSNELKIWNPLDDVPSPYQNDPATTPEWMMQASSSSTPFQTPLPHLQEKDPLKWQQELVQMAWRTGQPQLLRGVSTLVMAVVCALDTRTVLINRQSHQPNSFGAGNALLPPDTSSTDGLYPIHNRLSRSAAKEWKRPDVLGVLMASYALLLRSAPAALASPRSGSVSSPVTGSIDLRKSWRQCLEAPTEFKSFSFCRLGLLPGLQKPSDASDQTCDTAEFLLSSLASFASHYMEVLSGSGDQPISRAKWEQDAEEDLRLRRSHQEQQRQFQAWSGTRAVDMESVPSSVDLLQRPDCMDDVVAFSIALCSLGPNYALQFWSIEEDVDTNGVASGLPSMKLVPSRALRQLEIQQEDDESLSPCYLSFLAVLALAEDAGLSLDGAAAVNEILSSEPQSDGKVQITWSSLVEILRWYARELNPQEYSRATAASMATTGVSTGSPSTAYYYFDTDVAGSSSYGASQEASTDSGTSRSKTRELGEENTFILMSHLDLISSVAARSLAARLAILSVNLPILSSDSSEIIGQDSTLMILYTLAVMPLSPLVRGAVFNTLANLLMMDGANPEQKKILHEDAMKAWEMLEACQILPIHMLDQYPSVRDADARNISGLSFPPSSTALVVDKAGKTWIPADPAYSIVYEMEYIESSLGTYPSTEGFLCLLRSLFDAAGSPADLGRNWRVRSGCSPYIEYVMHLVLPRAMGQFPHLAALPFNSSQDRNHLVALALEVIDVAITRCIIPAAIPRKASLEVKDVASQRRELVKAAHDKFGLPSLSDTVIGEPNVKDANVFLDDFRAKSSSVAETTDSVLAESANSLSYRLPGQSSIVSSQSSMSPSVPRPKSPALSILVDILSSSGGELFRSIVAVFVEDDGAPIDGQEADKISLAYALFNDTPATFASSKAGRRKITSFSRQALLKSLRTFTEPLSYRCAVLWRERALLGALRAFCGTIVREDLLQRAIESLPGKSSIIPVLRFQKKSLGSSRLKVIDLQISKLSQLLLMSNVDTGVLEVIAGLIGYCSLTEDHDVSIASAAVSIIFYVDQQVSPQNSVGLPYRSVRDGQRRLASVFGKRLVVSAGRECSKADVDLFRLILNRMLTELRSRMSPSASLAQVMLGIPSDLAEETMRRTSAPPADAGAPRDCFDALLFVLKDEKFVFSQWSAELAADSYEVFFRLCRPTALDDVDIRRVFYSSQKLRSADFWKSHLERILAIMLSERPIVNDNVLHSIAWLLKSTANEMQLLGSSVCGAPQPNQLNRMLAFLFSPPYEVLPHLIRIVPIQRVDFDPTKCTVPSEEAVRGAKRKLQGAAEVVDGYQIVDETRLVELMKTRGPVDVDGLKAWTDQWNFSILRECVAAHLSNAIHLVLGSSAICRDASISYYPGMPLGGHKLLAMTLDRLLAGYASDSSKDMDEVFFTTASRNLALAALVSTRIAMEEAGGKEAVEAGIDVPVACALLARSIAYSGESMSRLCTDSGRKNERTAVLASALALLLKRAPFFDVAEGDMFDFYRAAVVLTRLACTASNNTIPLIPSTGAPIARSCLALLLELFQIETPPPSTREQSFMNAVLNERYSPSSGETRAQALVGLVALLDANIAELLQKIALLPSGAQMLIESRVFNALLAAADRYRAEEAKVVASQSSNASSYAKIVIAVPQFLPGHLELMGALMSVVDITPDCRHEIAIQTMNVLGRYEDVLSRILSRFPVDGEVLYTVVRCMSQSKILLKSARSIGTALSSRAVVQRPARGQNGSLETFERGLAALTMHIAENPLPPGFLPALPSFLLKTERPLPSAAVSIVSISSANSWWDTLNVKSRPADSFGWVSQLSDDVCMYGTVGADILICGLSILQGQMYNRFFDPSALARGLCSCTDAVRLIATTGQQRLSYIGSVNDREILAKTDNVKRLQAKLGVAVSELLVLVLDHVRHLKNGECSPEVQSSAGEFCKTMLFALNHIRLDTRGISLAEGQSLGDENLAAVVTELARALRKELESM